MIVAANQEHERCLSGVLSGVVDVLDQNISDLPISGVQLDSRLITKGNLFIACTGHEVDGRDFIGQAIAAGAVAVIAESLSDNNQNNNTLKNIGDNVPVIEVENLSTLAGLIAANYYGHPSNQVPVIAVTGTNGKTSCTQLIMQLLSKINQRSAVVGTLGCGVDQEFIDDVASTETSNTTPDAITLQRYLSQWVSEGVDVVAMEASSHGLVQGRVNGVQVKVAVFTNLTRDHLDYHGSMQAYAEAKAKLFQQEGLSWAVLNADDPFVHTLENIIDEEVAVLRYSAQATAKTCAGIDVWVESPSYKIDGVSGLLHSPWGEFEFTSPLLGAFNLSNLLAVITALGAMGYCVADMVTAITSLRTISGRMEIVRSSSSVNVVIDYAHTPDALEKALVAMRLHGSGKLWCVFGCGGGRDQGKRSQMGEVVERFADHVVVTSDNPRHEPADEIINNILAGIGRPSLVEADRSKAIEFAITHAAAGDSVLIAGKGHEQFQQYGDTKIPFSDMKQARLALVIREKSESEKSEQGAGQ